MNKQIIKYLLPLVAVFALCGCIRNDIPYARIVPVIKAFEVEGETKASQINNQAQEITVHIAETVDPRNVIIKMVDVSDNATFEPGVNATLDLSSEAKMTFHTYRDYVWIIRAKQVFEQEITVQNQISANIDDEKKSITVTVPGQQPLDAIKIMSLKLGPPSAVISPAPSTITDFTTPQQFSVSYYGRTEIWTISFVKTDVQIITGNINAWAKFAYIDALHFDGAADLTFEYREGEGGAWIRLPYSEITVNESMFSAKITNLKPITEYTVRAVSGASSADAKKFTTEAAFQVPNMSFDNWFMDGKSWYADLNLNIENYWWDSGNKGANTLSSVNPTSPEEAFVVEGKAAKLHSTSVFSVFAAGSLYLGRFSKVIGLSGAELEFGRPYTSRPTQLKGYYSYTSGKIDKAKAPYTSFMNTQDSCHIYAILADWDAPFLVNTSTNTFININSDPKIIAFGELKTDNTNPEYKKFAIDLQYRDLTRKPKYLVIISAASKYGDYFTGSTKSVLYLDQFELGFD